MEKGSGDEDIIKVNRSALSKTEVKIITFDKQLEIFEPPRHQDRTFAHAFTPPLNPLPIAWRGDFKMRFSPPLQVLERGPGGEVSESPARI